MKHGIHCPVPVGWCHYTRTNERLDEEACAGKPQAGFCRGEGSQRCKVEWCDTPESKDRSNGEYKADLSIEEAFST
jgi:hypothetical protein